MAGIDVSELMSDPDFVDGVQLITRASAINDFGENVLTDATPLNTVMVVQPATGKDIVKLPESAQGKETIAVWYAGELSTMRVSGYSDIIVWNNKRYEVQHVEPFDNWGNGYFKGIATLEKVGNG